MGIPEGHAMLDQIICRVRCIGKAFFEYVYQNYPAKRYRLEVTNCNTQAIKLYKQLGYTPLDYNQMIKDID